MILQLFCYLLEAIISLLVGYSVWWYFLRRPKNAPPGPYGVPLFGYSPFTFMSPGKKFKELGKKYGPIISYEQGLAYAIVINDYQLLKKAFQDMGELFSDKQNTTAFLEGSDSFVFHGGLIWRERRRFTLAALRDLGMGKAGIETKILDELNYFVEEIRKKNGEPFDIYDSLSLSVNNINSILQYSVRFDYGDKEMKDMRSLMIKVFEKPIFFILAPMFPVLVRSRIWKKLPGYFHTRNCVEAHERFTQRMIDTHVKDHYPGKRDDFTDAYLTEREERQKNGNHPEIFGDKYMLTDLRMMHLAASESSAMTLNWVGYVLIAHPDIQRKIQDEIDRVVGRNRQPTMADRVNMTYTEAFMQEMLRKFPIGDLLEPHKTTEDVLFEGYHIPKGTVVYGNLYAIHNNEADFPDPDTFRPERYINEEGKLIRSERLANFGVGKRNCIGEGFARTTLFLYVTSLLQNFDLSSQEPLGSITDAFFAPPAYKVHAKERENQ